MHLLAEVIDNQFDAAGFTNDTPDVPEGITDAVLHLFAGSGA